MCTYYKFTLSKEGRYASTDLCRLRNLKVYKAVLSIIIHIIHYYPTDVLPAPEIHRTSRTKKIRYMLTYDVCRRSTLYGACATSRCAISELCKLREVIKFVSTRTHSILLKFLFSPNHQ